MEDEYEEEDLFPTTDVTLTPHAPRVSRQRLDSRASMCFTSKGLVNEPGDNNCFLNAAVQILWNVNIFRRSFRLLSAHTCLHNACIFCALKGIFEQFEDTETNIIDPDELRKSMANAFADERRFQLGRMDDAAECFETILHRLHFHLTNGELENACSAKHCIPHQKFASHVLEQKSSHPVHLKWLSFIGPPLLAKRSYEFRVVFSKPILGPTKNDCLFGITRPYAFDKGWSVFCKCQASGEPKSFYQFVYYVTSAVLYEHRRNGGEFSSVLKPVIHSGDSRPCPDTKHCTHQNEGWTTHLETTLINCPDVMTVGVIWDTDAPRTDYIVNVLECFEETIYFTDMFDNIPDAEYRSVCLRLAGVVCYYGRHYTSFFYNSRQHLWMHYDDAHVRPLGSSWESVLGKCERSRYQPLLVVYTNSDGMPVDTSNAMTATQVVSKELLLAQPRSPLYRKHRRRKKNKDKVRSPSDESNTSRSNPESPVRKLHSPHASPGSRRRKTHSPHSSPSRHKNRSSKPRAKGTRDEISEIIMMPNETLNPAFRSHSALPGDASAKHEISTEADRSKTLPPAQNKPRHLALPNNTDVLENRKAGAGSFKKRFGNVMKNVRSIGKAKAKFIPINQAQDPSSVHRSNSLDSVFQNESHHVQSKSMWHSKQNDDVTKPKPSGGSPRQLRKLERHQELISHVETKVTRSASFTQNFQDPPRKDIGIDEERNLMTFSPEHETPTLQNGHQNSNPASDFEALVSSGEQHLYEAEYNERRGEMLLALNDSTEATRLFREASKQVKGNADLLEFVDRKRWFSYTRSAQLQKKLGFLDQNQQQENLINFEDSEKQSLSNYRFPNLPRPNVSMETRANTTAFVNNRPLRMKECFYIEDARSNIDKSRLLRAGDTEQPSDAESIRQSMHQNPQFYRKLSDATLAKRSALRSNSASLVIDSRNAKIDKNDSRTIYDQDFVIVDHASERKSSVGTHSTNEVLAKLRLGARIQCRQCGWRKVEAEGQCCITCQSEYL